MKCPKKAIYATSHQISEPTIKTPQADNKAICPHNGELPSSILVRSSFFFLNENMVGNHKDKPFCMVQKNSSCQKMSGSNISTCRSNWNSKVLTHALQSPRWEGKGGWVSPHTLTESSGGLWIFAQSTEGPFACKNLWNSFLKPAKSFLET